MLLEIYFVHKIKLNKLLIQILNNLGIFTKLFKNPSWFGMLLLSHFSRVRLCDPRDGSPPGSPVPGILQARTLEWVAISFSNA